MPFIPRRGFFACMAGLMVPAQAKSEGPRHGLHGKVTAHPGQRDAVAGILLDAAALVGKAPGFELYIVGISPTEPDECGSRKCSEARPTMMPRSPWKGSRS